MKFSKKIAKEAIFEIFLFFLVTLTIVLLWQNNTILFIALLIESGITIILWHQKYDIIYFIVGAILGPLVEIICIHYGVWAYTKPNLLGIPVWLPLVWGFATVILTRIARTIINIKNKK